MYAISPKELCEFFTGELGAIVCHYLLRDAMGCKDTLYSFSTVDIAVEFATGNTSNHLEWASTSTKNIRPWNDPA